MAIRLKVRQGITAIGDCSPSRITSTSASPIQRSRVSKPAPAPTLAELQAEHRARHNITIDSLTTDLENDRQLAHTEGQAGAAVSATLGKAKLHGLLKDKVEASGPEGGPIDLTVLWRLSADERRALRGIATKLAAKSTGAA